MRSFLPRWSRIAAFVLAVPMALATSPLWAQFEPEETKARWPLNYALVILLVGLSLYSICRPSTRRKRS